MTQFENLELLYTQFFSLTTEIEKMVKLEDFEDIEDKLENKDKLLKKILATKKTVEFTEDNMQKVKLLEKQLKEREQQTLIILKKRYIEVGEEIKNTKKKVKVNSAYIIDTGKRQGVYIDVKE